MKLWSILMVVVVFASPCPLWAANVGQIDDFESGTAGWQVGGKSQATNGPRVLGVGGVDGDFLNYTTDNENTGGRFLILNATTWTGNYLAAGISGISALARNDGNVELEMRLILEGSGGGFLTSGSNHLPVGGEWQSVFFPISAESLIGGDDLTQTLSSVEQIRIFHNPSPSFPGPFTTASMSIDNILAVPEPNSWAMLIWLAVCFPLRRCRRVNPLSA